MATNSTDSSSLRRLKAEHLKKRADQALQQGNYRLAWDTYTEAITAKPDKDGLCFLFSNRSLAYQKSQRYTDALNDADEAIKLAPTWPKGYWRKATALIGLQDIPGAVDAYHRCWQLQQDKSEAHAKLWQAIQKLTREQLAKAVLNLLGHLQTKGDLEGVKIESADDAATVEATFRLIVDAHRGKAVPGYYYKQYLAWLTDGIDTAQAYMLRAQIHCRSKCYLQARADASNAIISLAKSLEEHGGGDGEKEGLNSSKEKGGEGEAQPSVIENIALAYLYLGEAHLAEKDHPDRDPFGAFKALTKGTEFEQETNHGIRDKLQEASEELTNEQLERASLEAYNEGLLPNGAPLPPGIKSRGPSAGTGSLRPGERVFRVECCIAFPAGAPRALGPAVREAMRQSLAATAGVDVSAVTLEGVRPPRPPERTCMEVTVHVTIGPSVTRGSTLVKALLNQEELVEILGGVEGEVAVALGQPDAGQTRAELVDITPAYMDTASNNSTNNNGLESEQGGENRQLSVPARPKMDLELPYRMYRLVTSDGRPVERLDKHPFCMSRVYYSAAECPEGTWVEVADGSCRWRQTGSEVRILALKVPVDLPPRDLDVRFTPFHLSVINRRTEEVYLEGRLHRGVVPEDCFWTHCGGQGEDGCCLTLRKMNLEVLSRHWMHSEMWWPRLFEGHVDIAWDDYEKDYSDLPEEVMARHRVAEAIKDAERAVEGGERTKREALQEIDDLRKRKRQERLNQLRSGGGMRREG